MLSVLGRLFLAIPVAILLEPRCSSFSWVPEKMLSLLDELCSNFLLMYNSHIRSPAPLEILDMLKNNQVKNAEVWCVPLSQGCTPIGSTVNKQVKNAELTKLKV